MITSINAVIPGAEFTLSSFYPERCAIHRGLKKVSSPCSLAFKSKGYKFHLFLLLSMISHLLWGFFYRFLRINTQRIFLADAEGLHEYMTADTILTGGGDLFTDPFGTAVYIHLYLIFLAKLLKKTVMIYAHTIETKSPLLRFAFRRVLNLVDIIAVRDRRSKAFLKEIGVQNPNIYLTADPAFILPSISRGKARKILSEEGVQLTGKPLLGIAVSSSIYRRGFPDIADSREKFRMFVELAAAIVEYLINNLHATVILIPHSYGPGKTADDRTIIETIYLKLKNKNNVDSISGFYTSEEMKGLIGELDLLIATRMHPLVDAISMCVPCIGIDYDHKSYGLMESMGLEDYLIHIQNADLNGLIRTIDEAYSKRFWIKRKVNSKLEIMKKRAMHNAELVKWLSNSRRKL